MQILLADHERQHRRSTAAFLTNLGHKVAEADNGRKALEQYARSRHSFDLILIEFDLPDIPGLDLLGEINKSHSADKPAVIILSSSRDADQVIEAIRRGAYDYLLKPISPQELHQVLARAARHQEPAMPEAVNDQTAEAHTGQIIPEYMDNNTPYLPINGIGPVIFTSPLMRKVYEEAHILHTDRSIPVLIQGETGTGKELVARYIHFANHASSRPFIAVNCSNLSPTLFESELFGYEAGSFTGAFNSGKKGKIDLAQGGTLFFDEISELSFKTQAKLLRVLQEKEYYRLGGLKSLQTDVRIICATNQDIEQLIQHKRFRADLFYRLNTSYLKLPPLRERRDDIIPLARIFMKEFSGQRNKNYQSISRPAARALREYPWPGNIRQLRSIIDLCTLLHNDTELKADNLGIIMAAQQSPDNNTLHTHSPDWTNFELPADRLPLDTLNKLVIKRAMEMHNWNISKTARYLDISPRSLSYRIKQWDLKNTSNHD